MAVELERPSETDWARYKRVKSYGTVPDTTTTLLTGTSKMPSESWSLPAGPACPGMFLGEQSICGDPNDPKAHKCYAKGANYRRTTVARAQDRRFKWAIACMRTEAGREKFVRTMVDAIRATGKPFFRVHDSGDLFSPAYTHCWAAICRALPTVQFWFPTRMWRAYTPVQPRWVAALDDLLACDNATVRPSALRFDDPAPDMGGRWSAGTTATETADYSCPAPKQGNNCGSCRACWGKTQVVSYHAH